MLAKIALTVASLVVFSGVATAQVTCHADGFGNTRCHDVNGNTLTAHSDGFGNTTFDGNLGQAYAPVNEAAVEAEATRMATLRRQAIVEYLRRGDCANAERLAAHDAPWLDYVNAACEQQAEEARQRIQEGLEAAYEADAKKHAPPVHVEIPYIPGEWPPKTGLLANIH